MCGKDKGRHSRPFYLESKLEASINTTPLNEMLEGESLLGQSS